VYNTDLNGFALTINIGAGTYTEVFSFQQSFVGDSGSQVLIKGAGSTNTILQTNSSFNNYGIVTNGGSNVVRISGVSFQATGSTGQFLRGLFQFGPGIIYIDSDVNFGNFNVGTNSQHMYCESGRIQISTGYNVSGNASQHFTAGPGGFISTSGISTSFSSSFTNNPIFDVFAVAEFGWINTTACTFTGNATVTTLKSLANYNGVVINVVGWPGTTSNGINGGVIV
jgi:hypothetical protein